MITDGEQTALDAIEAQLNPMLTALEAAKAEEAKLQQAVQRLLTAKKAICGSKADRKAGKPCTDKATVLAACIELTKQNAPISQSDLKALVKDRLAATYNLSFVPKWLREILQSDAFDVSNDGQVSLAGNIQVTERASA